MKRVKLGRSAIEVCNAPLGAMYLGTKQRGEEAFALLDAYVQAGGDFIDTANIYAHWVPGGWRGGESESLLGDWMKLRGNRNQLVLATKVGFNYQDVPQGLLPRTIRAECEKSLKRLGVETIDLYFAHCDDPDVPQEAVLETFNTLIKEGKVRCLGASNFTTHRLATANLIAQSSGLPRYEVLQQRHTYLQPRPGADTGRQVVLTKDMINYCAASKLSIMAYSATLGGAYAKGIDRPLPDAYQSAANRSRLQALRDVASAHSVSPHQVVLAWLWSRADMLPLIAVSSKQQLQQNVTALEIKLTHAELDLLNSAE